MYEDRIRMQSLMSKVMSADEAAWLIKDGMNVATSGFTPSGYPKVVPMALADQVNSGKRQLKVNLWSGASTGDELDGQWARCGIIDKRLPYQTNNDLRRTLNTPQVNYMDLHLSLMAQNVRYGFFGPCDIAIVEVCAITEEGYLVPTTAVGNMTTFVAEAKQIIVELNLAQPKELEGMHDIYWVNDPPNREPIPLKNADERIGVPYIECDPQKIAAIVISDVLDDQRPLVAVDEVSQKIADNIVQFLKDEVAAGRMPAELLPLQSGVGSVANAVLEGLLCSDFENLEFYSEVIQDAALKLIDAGKMKICSGTSLTLSKEGMQEFYRKIAQYRDKIIMRPQEISNSPEVIRRLGVVAMNTAIEVDIYGNVNSTHIMGTKMMNGVGGSGDYASSAYITIFITSSLAKGATVSSIVPMVSHVDHVEHDVDIIITEQGIADLRNKSPRQRAVEIINHCAHPDYRSLLQDYYEEALAKTKGAHTPHLLDKCFSFHERYMTTGTMKLQ